MRIGCRNGVVGIDVAAGVIAKNCLIAREQVSSTAAGVVVEVRLRGREIGVGDEDVMSHAQICDVSDYCALVGRFG